MRPSACFALISAITCSEARKEKEPKIKDSQEHGSTSCSSRTIYIKATASQLTL